MRTFRTQCILIACPLAFCGFLSVSSRVWRDPFVVPAGNADTDARTFAYSDYVKQVTLLLADQNASQDRTRILGLAKQWDADANCGRLQPLTPISFEDSPEQGQRGRILATKTKLASFLVQDGERLARDGFVDQGVDEALLALRLNESLRYSDLTTVYCTGIQERSQIDFLRKWRPKMKTATRARVHEELQVVSRNLLKIRDIVRTTRQNYLNWRLRNNCPVTVRDWRTDSILAKECESDESTKDIIQEIWREDRPDPVLQSMFVDLRLAWRSGRESRSCTDLLLAA